MSDRPRRFRSEVQALRAIAVFAVVAFHFRPDLIPGGYIGVDVFFVISGFLITSHLSRELLSEGRISLARFWSRRVRRLLPASFTVLVASAVAALVWVPRSLWAETFSEIAASALYVQNWLLAGHSIDYLGAQNQPSLVQHFWSLAVEEQFYLLWPLLLLLATRLRGGRAAIRVAMVAVLAVSLTTSIVWTTVSAPSAYFVLPTRAWEFAAGGIVALLPTIVSGRIRTAASWIGLALIAASALLFDSSTPFPGFTAAVPVLGAACVIMAGGVEGRLSPGVLLRSRPLQAAGDLSYGIYLWHWPLLILYPFVIGRTANWAGLSVVLAATVALAFATKRLIEDPIRFNRAFAARPWPAFAAAAVASIVIAGGGVSVNTVTTQHIAEQQRLVRAAVEHGSGCFGASAMVAANGCSRIHARTDTVDPVSAQQDAPWIHGIAAIQHCVYPDVALGPIVAPCSFGNLKDPSRTIALIGDSHAQQLVDPLAAFATQHGWRLIVYGRSACNGFAAPDSAPGCEEWGRKVLDSVRSDRSISVVLFTNYSAEDPAPVDLVVARWNALRASGKEVIAVRDLPERSGTTPMPECVERSPLSYDPCAWRLHSTEDFMTESAALSDTPLIDLTSYVCRDDVCHSVIGGTIVSFDTNHLTSTFSQTLAPFIGADVEAAIGAR